MKNQVRHFTPWLAGFLTLASTVVGQAEIRLDGFYTDNMVLQLEEEGYTWLSGRASRAARVKASYKTSEARDKVDEQGVWEIKLKLRNLKDSSPANLILTETTSEKQQSQVVFTNVVVGQIWWLGVRGHGLPARSEALAKIKEDRFRFMDLPDSGVFSGWVSFTHPGDAAAIMNAFCLEATAHLGAGHVGIVQTSPEILHRLGIENPGSDKAKSLEWLNGVQIKLNQDVRKEQAALQQLLIKAKHDGVVTNLPIPVTYDVPKVRWHDKNFAPTTDPRLREFWRGKNFEAAIW